MLLAGARDDIVERELVPDVLEEREADAYLAHAGQQAGAEKADASVREPAAELGIEEPRG